MEPSDAIYPEGHRGTTSRDTTTFIPALPALPALAAALTSTPQSFIFHYLAEGNANVIYTLHQNPNVNANANATTPLPSEISAYLHHVVLRLRKDLAFTRPCMQVLSAFREKIQPLFAPEHSDLLLEQLPVKLTGEMVVGLNGILHAMESDAGVSDGAGGGARSRPMGRRGAYLPSFDVEGYGILMPNLNALGGRVVEFKPKWLVQSPSAPKDAERCRTCAVNLLRRMKGRHKGRGDGGFCPFALVSPDWEVLQVALRRVNGDAGAGARLQKEFVAKVQPALMHLSGLQRRYGGVGLEDFRHPAEKDFGVAMALRDCSVFLVVSDDHILDVKFADLDLKTTEGGKVEGWAETEEELILKGIYTDADGDGSQPCHWSREVG